MSNTWNFPCYTCSDWGSFDSANRGAHGMAWFLTRRFQQPSHLPIRLLVYSRSLYVQDGRTGAGVITQVLTSIGNGSESKNGLFVRSELQAAIITLGSRQITGQRELRCMRFWLGDEDGSLWIQPDKWYQVAFSMSPNRFFIRH